MLTEQQIESAGLNEWQELDLVESDNGDGVIFYYKVKQRNSDFVLVIASNQYSDPKNNHVAIYKFVTSLDQVYKIVDALQNFVDVLK